MNRKIVSYRWHLRQLMADAGLFSTTDLMPLLAERGISLSPAQVYRLVVQTPERLNLKALVALCDILSCTPSDLIEPTVEPTRKRAQDAAASGTREAKAVTPRRALITST